MSDSAYWADRHGYMRYADDRFADYVFRLITARAKPRHATALEFGAGMGRFSEPLVRTYDRVILVEPVEQYAGGLREQFGARGVDVVTATADEYVERARDHGPVDAYCFHLLHHLAEEERRSLFDFVCRTGSRGVFVEPNPHNPLIRLQIAVRSDMAFEEERQYLDLTRRRLEGEMRRSGLLPIAFQRLCFLPPALMNPLLRFTAPDRLGSLEEPLSRLPFLGSYQLLACRAAR